ncbi:hypothetical protein [Cellulomonas marina]|uniref:DUF4232 domain-containing protein n=1 Tax=Cellulomonas marina TaxID=988821 RepID=A0A1I0WQ36_9CELL|nr:hypothetical protein [Cellulomonas marina]SFA90885.1 hypothetical protein SAMN05421867_103157 [Cellulomonas marina]
MPASTRAPSGRPSPGGARPGTGAARPLPAHVYRRRRAVALVVLLALVAAVVVAVVAVVRLLSPDEGAAATDGPAAGALVAGVAGGQASAQGATGDASGAEGAPAAAPSPSPSEISGVPLCTADALRVAAVPTTTAFPAGTDPTFTLRIENTGDDPCLVDAGDAHREVVLTSGDDRVWSPRDCVPEGEGSRLLLLAGGSGDEQSLAWDRVRSAPGCPGGQATAGSGTYALTFSVAGATAQPAVFTLG